MQPKCEMLFAHHQRIEAPWGDTAFGDAERNVMTTGMLGGPNAVPDRHSAECARPEYYENC